MSDPPKSRKLRLRSPQRDRVVPIPARLEDWLPPNHLARLIWSAVCRLDLSGFERDLKIVEGHRGHPAADPRLMVALWIYAFSQGVSNARELDRLCVEHLAYIWLCGGVSVNYHSLSDFRVKHQNDLDELMTQVLALLEEAGLVTYEKIAQDGIRVRASAGAASFRRKPTLEKHLEEARQVVAQLKLQAEERQSSEAETTTFDDDDDGGRSRGQAARERAAKERLARLEAALDEIPSARASKPPKKQDEARVSTTDPEARVMKMADGGYRPAYNIQFAADSNNRVIVGVDVTNIGSDQGQAPPMEEQVEARSGQVPDIWLMDGGFNKHSSIEALSEKEIVVYTPVPSPKDRERDPHQALPKDSEKIAEWRLRMGTEEAKEIYKERASIIEWVNAQARSRHGLHQLRVRGLSKVKSIGLWIAVTHNLLILIKHNDGEVADVSVLPATEQVSPIAEVLEAIA